MRVGPDGTVYFADYAKAKAYAVTLGNSTPA